jgi:S1-C subfamily serine protease
MDLTTAIKHIQPSIVQINLQAHGFPRGGTSPQPVNLNQPLGTGFVISLEGYIVTANHVVEAGFEALENLQTETKILSIGFAYPNTQQMRGNFILMDFDLAETDKIHDIALLRLRSKEIPPMFGNAPPLKLEPVVLNTDRAEDGVAIGISGYPVGQSVLVTNGGFMATSWAFDVQRLKSPETPAFYRRLDIADSYLADINVNPGNSGGPVYLASDGSVVGICVGYLPTNVRDTNDSPMDYYYNTGLAVVVPSRYVRDLLERHAVN